MRGRVWLGHARSVRVEGVVVGRLYIHALALHSTCFLVLYSYVRALYSQKIPWAEFFDE